MVDKTDLIDSVFPIRQNPNKKPGLAALLSFVIPGLGQLYLGQLFKSFWVFSGSAMLCFGFGLCNVLAALDAYEVGRRIRLRDIDRGFTSAWLAVPAWCIRKLRERLTPTRGGSLFR